MSGGGGDKVCVSGGGGGGDKVCVSTPAKCSS